MVVGVLLVASCSRPAAPTVEAVAPSSTTTTSAPLRPGLGEREISLRDGPVDVPIELRIPAIGVDATILGVGMDDADVMDAPAGGADAPAWQQAFWYRGSAVPGQRSTALIAGHVNDPLGRPGVFARLDELGPGDLVTVHDTRDGSDVSFTVTSAHSYTLDEAAEPAVLREIYGDGPVAGSWPVPSTDGLAHLTLVTCAGTYRGVTHDHRLVVQAIQQR